MLGTVGRNRHQRFWANMLYEMLSTLAYERGGNSKCEGLKCLAIWNRNIDYSKGVRVRPKIPRT